MQVHTELNNVAISNNDDRILHCCLLYQEKVKVHGGVVVLFSNDVQLCSKAMVNQVRALNRKTLLNDLRTMFKGGLAPIVSAQGQSPSGHAHYNPPPALIGAQQVATAASPPVPVTRAEVSSHSHTLFIQFTILVLISIFSALSRILVYTLFDGFPGQSCFLEKTVCACSHVGPFIRKYGSVTRVLVVHIKRFYDFLGA